MTSNIYEIRKANLRALMEDAGGPNNLAKRLALSNPSFLSHLAGPRPTRNITEKTERKIEESLGLSQNRLDSPVGSRITYGTKPAAMVYSSTPSNDQLEKDIANLVDLAKGL